MMLSVCACSVSLDVVRVSYVVCCMLHVVRSTLTREDMDDLEVKVVQTRSDSRFATRGSNCAARIARWSGLHDLLHDNVLQLSATDV